MTRQCRLCNRPIVETTQDADVGRIQFYEGLCPTCAADIVDEIVEEPLTLTSWGLMQLVAADYRESEAFMSP